MTSGVFLNLNSLKVEASGLGSELEAALKGTFHRFVHKPPLMEPDIIISPMTRQESEQITVGDAKNLTRYWLHDDPDNNPFIVSCYRGSLDMVVYPNTPIRLKFKERKRQTGKFIGCVYLCILLAMLRRQELLFQGALVSKDDMPVMLCGVSGAGKTTVLLHLLQQGWDYLSDNTCLLKQGKVYPFRSKIAFNYHHFENYPKVFAEAQINPDSFKKAERYNLMRDLSRKYLPGYLLEAPAIKKMTNPFLHMSPEELFPNIKVLDQAKCRLLILLSPGSQLTLEKVSLEDAVSRLVLLHRFAWPQYTELSDLFHFVTGQPLLDFKDALEINLVDTNFYQLTVPSRTSFESVFSYFIEQIPPLLDATYNRSHS